MIEFWNSWWAFIFILSPFLIGMAGIAIFAYLSYRHFDRVILAFPNSLFVQNSARFSIGTNFKLRYFQITRISGLVTWPGFFIRRNELDIEDLKRLPPSISLLLKIGWWLCIIASIWLLLAVGLLKLTGAK